MQKNPCPQTHPATTYSVSTLRHTDTGGQLSVSLCQKYVRREVYSVKHALWMPSTQRTAKLDSMRWSSLLINKSPLSGPMTIKFNREHFISRFAYSSHNSWTETLWAIPRFGMVFNGKYTNPSKYLKVSFFSLFGFDFPKPQINLNIKSVSFYATLTIFKYYHHGNTSLNI